MCNEINLNYALETWKMYKKNLQNFYGNPHMSGKTFTILSVN